MAAEFGHIDFIFLGPSPSTWPLDPLLWNHSEFLFDPETRTFQATSSTSIFPPQSMNPITLWVGTNRVRCQLKTAPFKSVVSFPGQHRTALNSSACYYPDPINILRRSRELREGLSENHYQWVSSAVGVIASNEVDMTRALSDNKTISIPITF